MKTCALHNFHATSSPNRSICMKDNLFLLSTGSTQEDPSQHNGKIVDWDVKNHGQSTGQLREVLSFCMCDLGGGGGGGGT